MQLEESTRKPVFASSQLTRRDVAIAVRAQQRAVLGVHGADLLRHDPPTVMSSTTATSEETEAVVRYW